jgi:hypothetical protein
MPAKPKTEIRIVCANYGKKGQSSHSSHAWNKTTMAKAKQSLIDLDHRAELHPNSYYANEAPYRIQVREVTAWKDASNAT